MDRNLERLNTEGRMLSDTTGPNASIPSGPVRVLGFDGTDYSPDNTKAAGGSYRIGQYDRVPQDLPVYADSGTDYEAQR